MAAISHVFTIRRAAQILGRDEDLKTCYGSCPTSSSLKTGSCGFTLSMALKPPPSPTMASRLFAKLSRIRSIAPINLKTSVSRCSAYAYFESYAISIEITLEGLEFLLQIGCRPE